MCETVFELNDSILFCVAVCVFVFQMERMKESAIKLSTSTSSAVYSKSSRFSEGEQKDIERSDAF